MASHIRHRLPDFITIPSGAFPMGTPEGELSELARRYGGTRESYREESPRHPVALAAYAIARTPVTNALYGAFVAATGARAPLMWRGATPPAALLDHPVADVSWEEAATCAAWLRQMTGLALRLPTEAEWERAARGDDGRLFPWGDAFDPALANTREGGAAGTSPVGAYAAGASPWGALDMAGNVWEWTASLDAPYPYVAEDGRETPGRPGRRIMRGGCYANPQGYARCACRFRLPPTARNEFTGFRLAHDG
ncbi:MAG TPA: formylglycine-generating enzyme family protein [Chloroflexaceae bacterium]|nr:formylglycine-generating enzyme family protein [Chloroflexaceae bacterium]